MALINQFQTYSQKENAVTNNVLLMLSRLYQIGPAYYADYISAITEASDGYEVIPAFRQQVGNRGNGIIDGYIHLPASKIIIETKLSSLEFKEKLLKYAESFDSTDHKILLHLSSQRYSDADERGINELLKPMVEGTPVHFYSKTFEDFAIQLDLLAGEHPYERSLRQLSDDFGDYCESSSLIINDQHTLRAMACGQSFDLNVKHQFYFDDATRGYRPFTYLGIYASKSVRCIGRVENMIVADYSPDEGLTVLENESDVTDEQKERLIKSIIESVDEGWNIQTGHRFFLLKDFCETDFQKTSPGGIFRVRYFDLKEELKSVPGTTVEIAEKLRQVTWE
jgi:hypothetical protein